MTEIQDFLEKGGLLMYPIIILLVVGLAVFLERLYTLQRGRVIPMPFVQLLRKKIVAGRADEALTLCEGNPSPVSAVAAAGLKLSGRSRSVVKEAFEEVGRLEVSALNRFVEVLGTIAAIAPLLGLLGTVIGMIKMFDTLVAGQVATEGAVDPGSLANGISLALYTTAAGLVVAVPTFVAYKFLSSRVERLALEMEEVTLDLLNLMTVEEPAGEPVAEAPATETQPSEAAG
ncbi:MAG: MotA/TolQ/ExbB proton channel family protein [Bradymonadia bacterium]